MSGESRNPRRNLSRALTRIANADVSETLAQQSVLPAENLPRIGITGAPGAGKSSLIARLANLRKRADQKVAVLAVDIGFIGCTRAGLGRAGPGRHVAGRAGSHVVIRYTDDDLPGETLLDAAILAVHFSQARGGGAEVHRTRCKHVSKFRGANPGQVQLARHKGLRVRPDPERLDRLVTSPNPS